MLINKTGFSLLNSSKYKKCLGTKRGGGGLSAVARRASLRGSGGKATSGVQGKALVGASGGIVRLRPPEANEISALLYKILELNLKLSVFFIAA